VADGGEVAVQGPAFDDREPGEVHLVAGEDHFLADARTDLLRGHLGEFEEFGIFWSLARKVDGGSGLMRWARRAARGSSASPRAISMRR